MTKSAFTDVSDVCAKWIRNPSRCTVARRQSTTRHELHMQLPPNPMQVCAVALDEYKCWIKSIQGCVYCGSDANTWDHLHPLVVDGMPSGIVPCQLELLPCCSRCNSSKGKTHWRLYMDRLVAKSRQAPDHVARVQWLQQYDAWRARHEQRWDASVHEDTIRELSAVIGDCHQFMQQMINRAVVRIHGPNACCFRHTETQYDWSSIEAQLRHQNTSI